MQITQPPTPYASRPTPVKFSGMGPMLVSGTDRVLSTIQKNRTREMLFEDLMGFGFLRTGMDLFRQYFFKNENGETRHLNVPAARERLIRETGSIFTDNFSGGIFAYAIAGLANRFSKGGKNFANQFASDETLELFHHLVRQSSSSEAFLKTLARKIDPTRAEAILPMLKTGIASQKKAGFENAAIQIAQLLKANKSTLEKTLDVSIHNRMFPLDTLVEDAAQFLKFTKAQSIRNKGWQTVAREGIERTLKIGAWRLPISLGLAMGLTLAMPYVNRYITEKVDGIESYPGEMGLRKLARIQENTAKSGLDRWFPYISESLKKGNPLPLLGTLIPLPFAFGIFDTAKLASGSIKQAFNNPLAKGFLKRLGSMLQFGKGFPFTTQQQMASCFAFLIFSRMISARSDIEYRERMVDSFLGWAIWILATPRIKNFIAHRWDKNLLKTVGTETVLKRRIEIERLLPKSLLKNTLGRFIVMSAASLGITVAMLGVVEPYAAIKWTEWQARRKARPQM